MEPIDIEDPCSLLDYLRRTRRISPSEQIRARKLEGGVSNRTVLVERASGEAWVLKQALAKLRVQVDWFSSPERIGREAAGLRWLAELAPPGCTTALIFEDPEEHLLAMEAVPEPHENWKTLLLAGVVQPEYFRRFAELLAAVHREGYRRRDEVRAAFEDRSFFESLRLEPYYSYSAQQAPRAAGFLTGLIDETLALRLTLVHGDYSPKNVLIQGGRMVLLDHEVIHFGDPAFDLGFSLTHFLSKAHHLPRLRPAFANAAREYWAAYGEALGALPWAADLEPRAVRHTLACLLARVSGRSPLEYLDARERRRQRDIVLEMMAAPPVRVPQLILGFTERLEECHESNG
jgi:tRNA A-37 threonylcarbamoyl transferase component Bud32